MAESYIPGNSTICDLEKPSSSEAGKNKVNRKIFSIRNTDNPTTIKNVTRVDYDHHGLNDKVRDRQGVNRQAYNSRFLKRSDYDLDRYYADYVHYANYVRENDAYSFDCFGNYYPDDCDNNVIKTENYEEKRLGKFGYNSYGFSMHVADRAVALTETIHAYNNTVLSASRSLASVALDEAKEQRQQPIKSKPKFNIPDSLTTIKSVTSVDYDHLGHNDKGEDRQGLERQSYKCRSVKPSSYDVEGHDAHSHDFLGCDLDCRTSNVLGTEHYEERRLNKNGCTSNGFFMDLPDSAAALEENRHAYNHTVLSASKSLAAVAVDEVKEQGQQQIKSKPKFNTPEDSTICVLDCRVKFNIPEDSTICVLEKSSCANEAGTNEVIRNMFWIRNTDNPTSNNYVTRVDCDGRG